MSSLIWAFIISPELNFNIMKLVWKNIGHYADELSPRWEAVIPGLIITIWKCPYMRGWRFSFKSAGGWALEELTGDYLSNFWDKATKGEVQKWLIGALEEDENLAQLVAAGTKLDKKMATFLKGDN